MYPYVSKPKIDRKEQIPNRLILELLTSSEIRMIKNRWQIVNLLENGLSIRSIAGEVKVGTDTVVRVARMLEKVNFRKLMGDERKVRKIKSNTPWIFGKSND